MRTLVGLIGAWVISSNALVALPAALNGQPLPSLAPMLESATPAVVNIATRGRVQVQTTPLFDDPFFRRFFEVPERVRETKSLGSGVVIDAKKGLVVTNHHVIAQAEQITVTLRDGRRLSAKLMGSDADTDVALLKVEPDNLTSIPLADSSQLKVGDFVVAIGNPFGLGQTVTSGIVSALGRSGLGIQGFEDFIQTDASINVGNSGGALVNLRGELVGINTAILAPNGGNVGIGFAIPSNMTMSIVNELVEHGRVRRGLLGVATQDMTPTVASHFGLPDVPGALIVQVAPESPAWVAGLRPGDILTRIGSHPIRDAGDVGNAIGLSRVERELNVIVVRNGEKQQFTAVLRPREERVVDGDSLHRRLSGLRLGNVEESGEGAVIVLDVQSGSSGWELGFVRGDVIVAANRRRIQNLTELNHLATRTDSLMLTVVREGQQLFVLVR
ncbi:MAG: Do family serine endopeptidase [Pseudomonadota bacterium]